MRKLSKILMSLMLAIVFIVPITLSGCGEDKDEIKTSFSVNVSQNANGQVMVDKINAEAGDTVTVYAVPDTGYLLQYLLCDGKKINSIYITMPDHDIIVSAIFEHIEGMTLPSINVVQNSHGQVAVNKSSAEAGETVTVTVTPDEGYILYALLCDGKTINSTNITMPNHDIVVSAIFKEVGGSVELKKGTYVSVFYGSRGGSYSIENGLFFNTITIKENNTCDVFVKNGNEIVTVENLVYSQDDRSITADFDSYSYNIEVVDNETFILYVDDYTLELFCFQEDCELSSGNYQTFEYESGDGYSVNIKQNNKIDITVKNDGIVVFQAQDKSYFIKGSVMYIFLEDKVILVQISGYDENFFSVHRLVMQNNVSGEVELSDTWIGFELID